MRRLLCLLLVAGVVGGCGSDEARAPALPAVRLAVESPLDTDTTTDDEVTVSGSVSPAGATVLVDGEEADTQGGRFTHTVALDAGTNVVDVQAAAPRRPAAMTALRVTRQVPVAIPDVAGETPDAAAGRLRALGFEVERERGGGLLDEFLGGTLGVCGTDPEAGDEALPGTTVTLDVRNSC